jgi:hypothetical protein
LLNHEKAMNGRSIFVLLALSLTSTLAACGGDDPEPQQSSTLHLNGTYRPVTQGAIASVTFSNDKDYYLVPSGCAGGDCVDIGTYRLDSATSTIVLKNVETGRERTITLENVKTSDAAVALVKTFVGTRDFVGRNQETTTGSQQLNGGGQSQVTGDQQQLNDGQSKITGQIVELLKTIVEALMNKQDMKKDDQKEDDKKDDQKDDEQPKPNPFDCKQGVPTANSTAAEKLAYAARCPNGP